MAGRKFIKTTVVAGCLAALLSGCGTRGGLELSPEQRAEVARKATAQEGQGKPEGATGKPHQGFILDDLLR